MAQPIDAAAATGTSPPTPQLVSEGRLADLQRYVLDDGWVLEQKVDGHRLLVALDPDGPPRARSKVGTRYTGAVPAGVRALRGTGALDGELLDGVLWVFDVAVPGVPLTVRRAVLESTSAGWSATGPVRLLPQARTVQEKLALAEAVVGLGLEGVVAKRVGGLYRSGVRSPDWVKLKVTRTVDVVVTGVDVGGRSATVSVRSPDGWRVVGRCALTGPVGRSVRVGSVVEVEYLYVGARGRLFQPVLRRVREDRSPEACDGQGLHVANKTVLPALPAPS